MIEPDYRRLTPETKKYSKMTKDESLWYPPLGLMKLSRLHKNRGDEVKFVYGCVSNIFQKPDLFSPGELWDRVYITTLFTYRWNETVRTIEFYKDAVGRSKTKIFIGGVMASLMPDDIFEETGIYPITGVLNNVNQIGIKGDENIDLLPPDYDLVGGDLYAINETYYGYTSRGCVNDCAWCGVPKIEPKFIPYIDIKPTIKKLRQLYGDKPLLKLMDNNVLASPKLKKIVVDLIELGYGRENYTKTNPPRRRTIDFNQGLDARYLTEDKMKLLANLNINPMRIGFDRLHEKDCYIRAVKLARKYGITRLSNYMLFNFRDTPRDLYERLRINIEINEKWLREGGSNYYCSIYSYPMRYAPIEKNGAFNANRSRDHVDPEPEGKRDLLNKAVWNRRFIRNVGIMSGAAHGAISHTPSLALRTIGATYEEFIANLYMPETLLRNRNKYERKVYKHEPKRKPGTGDVEAFRELILRRLKEPDETFLHFHKAVSQNKKKAALEYLNQCKDPEVRKWLKFYLYK